jgi:hypothetical protein
LAASRGYGARPAYFCDDSAMPASHDGARMDESVSVRLKRNFCGMAAGFDAQARASQEKFNAFLRTARDSNDRRMQLWRRDSKDNTTVSPRRRI